MGNLASIQSALAAKLNTFATSQSIPVYFENNKYSPTSGVTHLRAFFLPGKYSAVGCGTDSQNRLYGVYAINIYTKKEIGYGAANNLADLLITEFKRGTVLTKNDVEITIRRTVPSPYDEDELWYILPLSVMFYADTPNQ